MTRLLVFVSSNAGKASEVEAILGFPIERIDLDLPEIQAIDVAIVARDKVLAAYRAVDRPVFVEDTGLFFEALGNLPGALVRWFLMSLGPEKICELVPDEAGRVATARTAVAFCDGDVVEVFVGETSGIVTSAPRGAGGFGWDAIFQPDGSDRTFAEMDQAERNRYSMRRKAVQQLRDRVSPASPHD